MLMIGQWAASVSLSLTASREDDRQNGTKFGGFTWDGLSENEEYGAYAEFTLRVPWGCFKETVSLSRAAEPRYNERLSTESHTYQDVDS